MFCWTYVSAILLHKDQSSPSTWQWLSRFEFGSWGGVSTIETKGMIRRVITLLFHFNPINFKRFQQTRCLERYRPMLEFCESFIFTWFMWRFCRKWYKLISIYDGLSVSYRFLFSTQSRFSKARILLSKQWHRMVTSLFAKVETKSN